jgi:gluconolactonase
MVSAAATLFAQGQTIGRIERYDPGFDSLVPYNARIEVLAHGFDWTEGPVWVPQGQYLLFSDIPRNSIYQWSEDEGIRLFLKPAGYTGAGPWSDEPGTNGLLLDLQGRLVMCEHGDRRITRLDHEYDAIKTALATNYQGKRFNSPNDGVFKSNGDLYFTDPPYGLPDRFTDRHRELDFCGVYRLGTDGKVTLLTKEMTAPNGIGFAPDEKTLYVAQSDPKQAIWRAFSVEADGTLGKSRVFYDATQWVGRRKGLPDGMAVDVHGNLFATGPGGVLVFAPTGKLLGRIDTREQTANCKFGEQGSTLFIAADSYICRVRTTTRGLGFKAAAAQ